MTTDEPGASGIDPQQIRSNDDFVRALRLLYIRSGLSYQRMEKAAKRLPPRKDGLRWEILPKSVVGEIVNGKRLPTRSRLMTFLAVCNVKPTDVKSWLKAWELVTEPDPQSKLTRLSLSDLLQVGYGARIRDLAPKYLIDRQEEVQELVDFAHSDEPYRLWEGFPWSGKSALFSWFTINHPPQIEVASFFISSTRAAYSDWRGFLDIMTQQLSTLAGDPELEVSGYSQREVTFSGLLTKAGHAVMSRSHSLLLLIDGVDDDRGLDPSNTDTSILSLLPKVLPSNVHVAISRRPSPPLPLDLADDHPIRNASVVMLSPWSGAVSAEQAARQALFTLLNGPPQQVDILGLIAASGGGLSAGDLLELTNYAPYEVESLLRGPFGRNVVRGFSDTPSSDNDPLLIGYEFAHRSLSEEANRSLGVRKLAEYRQQILRWADGYARQNWPASTPIYLLLEYSTVLRTNNLSKELLSCALDPRRQHRMLVTTGGDGAVLREIDSAYEVLCRSKPAPHADLLRLAIRRHMLAQMNRHLPPEVPGIWARIGQARRGWLLMQGILDPESRDNAISELARAWLDLGNWSVPLRLAKSITRIDRRFMLYQTVAERAASMRNRTQLEQVAALAESELSEYPPEQEPDDWAVLRALETSCSVLSLADRYGRALSVALALPDRSRETALSAMSKSLAERSRFEEAIDAAEHLDAGSGRQRASVFSQIAILAAGQERLDTGIALLDQIPDAYHKSKAVEILAKTAVAERKFGLALSLLSKLDGWEQHACAEQVAAEVARVSGVAKGIAALRPYLEGNSEIAEDISLEKIGKRLAQAGDFASARQLIEHMHSEHSADHVRSAIIEAAISKGRSDLARSLLDEMTTDKSLPRALLAKNLAEQGHVREAENLLRDLHPGQYDEVKCLEAMADAFEGIGDRERAIAIDLDIVSVRNYYSGDGHASQMAMNWAGMVLRRVRELASRSKFLRAQEQLAQLSLNQDRSRAWAIMADAAAKQHRKEDAAKYARRSEGEARVIPREAVENSYLAMAAAVAELDIPLALDLDGRAVGIRRSLDAERIDWVTVLSHSEFFGYQQSPVMSHPYMLAWGKVGSEEIDEAYQQAVSIGDLQRRLWAICGLVKAAGRFNRFDMCALGVNGMPLSVQQLIGLASVLMELARWGRTDNVDTLVRKLLRLSRRERSAWEMRALMGDAVGTVTVMGLSAQTLRDQLSGGFPTEAMPYLLGAIAFAGRTDIALRRARLLRSLDVRVHALCLIAQREDERGNPERARRILREAHTAARSELNNLKRMSCLCTLTSVAFQIEQLKLSRKYAIQTSAELDVLREMSREERDIATGLAAVANAASGIFDEAWELAGRIEDQTQRAWVLQACFRYALELREVRWCSVLQQSATAAVSGVSDPLVRGNVLMAMAAMQIEHDAASSEALLLTVLQEGGWMPAVRVLSQINSGALISVARELAELFDTSNTLAVSQQ